MMNRISVSFSLEEIPVERKEKTIQKTTKNKNSKT